MSENYKIGIDKSSGTDMSSISMFMSVKKGFTPSTNQITYYSSRSKSLGGGSKHGELFWTAAMVCSGVEGLNHEEDNQSIQFIRA